MIYIVKLLFAIAGAFSIFLGLSAIAPGFLRHPRYKHGITLVYFSAFFMFYKGDSLVHHLVFYGTMILIMMLLYNLSSFISGITAVLYYLCSLVASMIATNLGLLLFGQVIDYRNIFAYQHISLTLIYFILFIIVLKYYQLIMKIFKNIISINRRIERLLLATNFFIIGLVIFYQRITFASVVTIASSGVMHAQGGAMVHNYMLYSFLGLTGLTMALVPLVNRLFIVDNNLESYKYKAEIDHMTGVLAREAGIAHLKSEMNRSAVKGFDLTIAYIDVNDLKVVNDKFGHKEGDRLIKAITDVIQTNLREFDIISRLGGDEFMIVFSKCNQIQAKKVWQRINDELLQVNLEGVYRFRISASAGFTQYDPIKHKNFNDILHEADEEMYHQKKTLKKASAR